MRKKQLVILAVIFFVLAFQSVNAQEITPSITSDVPSPTPIQYALPYPGILPGHPLYFVKDTRDMVIGFFISQPLKRANYNLLQADKNLQSSMMLTEQKKDNMIIVQTVKKAEDYFENAIKKTAEAKQ